MGVGGKEEGSNRGMLVTVTEKGSLRKEQVFVGKSEIILTMLCLKCP